jgi:predicted nucleotidyltransferase component of viral defense system
MPSLLNKEKHQLLMGRILKDIYSDTSISPLLGFKGGTCAYFFYGLPRFSVDLDFDFLGADEAEQKIIFEKVLSILKQYGEIKDSWIKRFTIFALLSYGDADHNIKIEINIRESALKTEDFYELKEYLGISMLAAKKEYLFAGKLAALTLRKELAMRDVYDIYYFAKNNWDINSEALKAITGKSVKEQVSDCLAIIEKIKDSEVLRNLGELMGEKEKSWVKKALLSEVIFLLKNYQAVLK